jgi:hypothetical protein
MVEVAIPASAIQLRFRGATGSGSEGDIAVDDVHLSPKACVQPRPYELCDLADEPGCSIAVKISNPLAVFPTASKSNTLAMAEGEVVSTSYDATVIHGLKQDTSSSTFEKYLVLPLLPTGTPGTATFSVLVTNVPHEALDLQIMVQRVNSTMSCASVVFTAMYGAGQLWTATQTFTYSAGEAGWSNVRSLGTVDPGIFNLTLQASGSPCYLRKIHLVHNSSRASFLTMQPTLENAQEDVKKEWLSLTGKTLSQSSTAHLAAPG